MKKVILLIKHYNFSFADIGILDQLRSKFPEYEIEVISIKDIYKKNFYKWFIFNLFSLIYEYGWDFLTGNKKLRSTLMYFKNTAFIAGRFQKKIKRHIGLDPERYLFTFQLQSLFNGSTPFVPHFVYTDHVALANYTYPHINPREYDRSKSYLKIERSLYRDAAICFTMSSNISRLLTEQYKINEDKVKCIYAGGNNALSYEDSQNTYTSKNILFIGVDWKRKGGPFLEQVFREVLKEIPEAQLTVIGCSPEVNTAHINVLGRLKPAELVEHFKKASVFCLPTLREPFGLVFIEAMRYKLPIVSNCIGALPDMVINDYNGYLPDYNVGNYTKVLVKLLTDPELCRKLGENGNRHACEHYTWDKVGVSLRKNIESVVPLN